MKYKTTPVIIGNNAWISANTIILHETQISDNSVVGASFVLKGKYPNYMLIVQKRDTKSFPREG